MTSATSLPGSINPRRQSTYGQIMAGTGGLPSTHSAAIRSSSTSTNSKYNKASNRSSGIGFFQNSQHRNQSIKARIARLCPSLIHGSSRRQRNTLVMIVAGGLIVMIFFLSAYDIEISPSVLEKSSSSSQSQQQRVIVNPPPQEPIEYKNPDGTPMDPKSIFMIRDFGSPACEKAYAGQERTLPKEIRLERDLSTTQYLRSMTRADAWTLSLTWKRTLKAMLPNWKEYSPGWVGQGVVLGAFADGDGRDTTSNILVQIKLIRSVSSIPIEVWFENGNDVSEILHESIASWGAVIRFLDEDLSTVSDGVVILPDSDVPVGLTSTPIGSGDIQEVKDKLENNPAQLQKALTIAALINSGFEDIIYFSPSTLPMQSPRLVFQQPEYIQKGAVFWQHPTSFPSYNSPIWPIIQSDCTPNTYEQSWSSFALRHKDSWKGLFLAWHWLTGPESETYEKIFGKQGNDLMRAAWLGVGRPFSIIDRMPQAGLVDMSSSKGDGIGCNIGSNIYPTPGADILHNPKKYAADQVRHQRLYQQSYRYGDHEGFFIENTNVMMIDSEPNSSLVHSGSSAQGIHKALNNALTMRRDPTRLILTDAYSAGSNGRTCLRITRKLRGHQHE
ncbi:hypothetical protein BGZ76_010277 [Entomortierella beljakovae]|nr:hypothetical protein BGZ76_010277 [Entomortierella beljakovae]